MQPCPRKAEATLLKQLKFAPGDGLYVWPFFMRAVAKP